MLCSLSLFSRKDAIAHELYENFWSPREYGDYARKHIIRIPSCMDLSVDGIELDVQLTKDGELVVIHEKVCEHSCFAYLLR